MRTWPRHDRTREFLLNMWFVTIMRAEIGELSGTSASGGNPTNLRTLGIVSGATTSAGALGFLLSKTIGFSCPFRSMGFACPGCGCSRAVEVLFREGPFEMFRAQPTATIFILFIGISLGWSLFGYAHTRRAVVSMVKYSQVMLMLVLLSASSNWAYQLAHAN